MFENREAKFLLLGGMITIGVLYLLSRWYPSIAHIIFLIALFIFAFLLIILQIYYIIKLFKHDKLDQKKLMTPCPACDALIYKTDSTCPYCKTSIRSS